MFIITVSVSKKIFRFLISFINKNFRLRDKRLMHQQNKSDKAKNFRSNEHKTKLKSNDFEILHIDFYSIFHACQIVQVFLLI